MTDIQRNAVFRDVTSRLVRASHEELRLIDRAYLRLEQLRSLAWTRRIATTPHDADTSFHLASHTGQSRVTLCEGRWLILDEVESPIEGPPVHAMCRACARTWCRGRDVDLLMAMLDVAAELAQEDLLRAELHEQARVEMTGGGS